MLFNVTNKIYGKGTEVSFFNGGMLIEKKKEKVIKHCDAYINVVWSITAYCKCSRNK